MTRVDRFDVVENADASDRIASFLKLTDLRLEGVKRRRLLQVDAVGYAQYRHSQMQFVSRPVIYHGLRHRLHVGDVLAEKAHMIGRR